MPPDPVPTPIPRPRRGRTKDAFLPDRREDQPGQETNGAELVEFARNPVEPSDLEREAWRAGVAALTTMPAAEKLDATAGIAELRIAARAELEAASDHVSRLLHEPPEMLASGIGERLGAQVLAMISTSPPAPLLLERLDPSGHTILYGTGGIGKGTLASHWLVQLTRLGRRVLIVDYENHPDEWSRRYVGLGGDRPANVLHVAPLTSAWRGARGPIWKNAEDLLDLSRQFGAEYLLIDSIVPACAGSDPFKPEIVSQYTAALEYLGLPALSLGHVTKADDLRYPFGSIFWHNLARTTWSLKMEGDAVVLNHRKHNNYERISPQRIDVTFDSDGMPVDIWEKLWSEDLGRRISAVLVGGPKSVSDITDELNDEMESESSISSDSVRRTLNRGRKAVPPRFEKVARAWQNA